jgi:hypothetical protein
MAKIINRLIECHSTKFYLLFDLGERADVFISA